MDKRNDIALLKLRNNPGVESRLETHAAEPIEFCPASFEATDEVRNGIPHPQMVEIFSNIFFSVLRRLRLGQGGERRQDGA